MPEAYLERHYTEKHVPEAPAERHNLEKKKLMMSGPFLMFHASFLMSYSSSYIIFTCPTFYYLLMSTTLVTMFLRLTMGSQDDLTGLLARPNSMLSRSLLAY